MTDDGLNRRRLLQAGGLSLATALAGCNSSEYLKSPSNISSADTDESTDEDEEGDGFVPPSERDYEQKFEVPPVDNMSTNGGTNGQGNVPIEILFEIRQIEGRNFVTFEDSITFELFVYDKYPVGNDVELTKVAEKTSTPYRTSNESMEIPLANIPKNKAIRFRLRATNNETGKSEWQLDQRLYSYLEFDDGETMFATTTSTLTPIRGIERPLYDFEDQGDSYKKHFFGGQEFASPEILEEVPYSREAIKTEYDLWDADHQPVCYPKAISTIEMPQEHVDLSQQLMETNFTSNFYDTFVADYRVPDEYDYYGRDRYQVLDNPIYQEMADTMHRAQDSYGVTNHYAHIRRVANSIQTNPYERIEEGGLRSAPIHLPEAYWADPTENCVGHSFQLCWWLYHLGYTCGTVWLDRPGLGTASHVGVALPIPIEVLEEDFPDGYPDALFTGGNSAYTIANISRNYSDDILPETLGEHPWVYIESTAVTNLGVIPFDDVRKSDVMWTIEPEDNVFGTDIGAPHRRGSFE